MKKRLITLRTIQAEKIDRSRSWIYAEIAASRFPRPLPNVSGPNLWDEAVVDSWLDQFIAQASVDEQP